LAPRLVAQLLRLGAEAGVCPRLAQRGARWGCRDRL